MAEDRADRDLRTTACHRRSIASEDRQHLTTPMKFIRLSAV